jgi:hypothetical protein
VKSSFHIFYSKYFLFQCGRSLQVEKPLVTTYPPSRVTDMKVVSMQVDQMSVTIEWTATGQQLDQGIGNPRH